MSENKGIQTVDVTPMALIASAQKSGASIEQMQQLLDLQMRWEENEARKAFNVAMSAFRAECPTINKDKKGHNTKYASLANAVETVKPCMANNGLSHRWKTMQDNGKIIVSCIVSHELGHSETTTLESDPDKSGSKNNIQAIGSATAYLERYTFFAALGLASDEMDDDGKKSDGVKRLDENQVANIEGLLSEIGASESQFVGFMRSVANTKIDNISDIPDEFYEAAVKSLEDRRA